MDATQSMRFLLVRHAHVDGAVGLGPDTPLSPRGRAQADWLGPALGGEAVSALLTSPSLRARQTAERLAGPLGLDPTIEAALAEFEIGVESAASYELAQELRPDLAVWHPEHRGPRESLADFQTRVTALVTALSLRAAAGDTLVLVTHAGVIDAVLRWAWGLTSRNVWLAEVRAPHASLTEIEHWPRGRHPGGAPRYSVVKRIGDASALPGELQSE